MLKIRNLKKRFDHSDVLRGVSLDIAAGEFVTLLGPSGCGKTTTLRIVAGLAVPDEGSVVLDGREITDLPPEKRDVNTVFQSYALFPHMNIEKNIAYGLRVRGVKKAERERLVKQMLHLVDLDGYEKRMPSQLSGGQRQRVAIARAVVLEPKLLLLDEPLGALDLKLRQQMQRELKDIQKRLGIAFLYVTHDQEEALNLSDRIAIMRDGLIEQVGAPEDIYERPATRFAAEFIGQSNFLRCEVVDCSGDVPVLSYAGHRFPGRPGGPSLKAGDAVEVCLRIERVRLARLPSAGCCLPGVLCARHYAGGSIRETVELPGGQQILAVEQTAVMDKMDVGERVYVCWNPNEAALVQ